MAYSNRYQASLQPFLPCQSIVPCLGLSADCSCHGSIACSRSSAPACMQQTALLGFQDNVLAVGAEAESAT